MKEIILRNISPGVDFGSNVQCPKCGSNDLRRMWNGLSTNLHSQTQTQEYLRVYCNSCQYQIGEEHTKDHVA